MMHSDVASGSLLTNEEVEIFLVVTHERKISK